MWLRQCWSAAQSAQVGGDLTFPFLDWTEPGVSLHSPMTIYPSFPPPFAPKLRYPSINTKERLHHLRFGESMFRWLLRINRTRPLSTPLSTAFIVRLDEVKTCRLITAYIKTATPDFYNGSWSSCFESAKLQGVRGILGSFPSRPGTMFSLRSHTACLTLLHRYVNIRTAISLISPPVGKIYTGVFVSRVEVIDRPRPSRLALFL